MAVPAGNIGSVEAGHGAGLDDEVLDALVERVAEVDGAISVRRAVVEDVARLAGAGLANLAVEVVPLEVRLLPRGEARGLVLRQVGLHGKAGLREIERGLERLGDSLTLSGG